LVRAQEERESKKEKRKIAGSEKTTRGLDLWKIKGEGNEALQGRAEGTTAKKRFGTSLRGRPLYIP